MVSFSNCNIFIGAAPDVQHYASQNREPHSSLIHGSISLVDTDDESEWLHRNDAYDIQARPIRLGSLIQLSGNIISSAS
jgi:hypothetical protein